MPGKQRWLWPGEESVSISVPSGSASQAEGGERLSCLSCRPYAGHSPRCTRSASGSCLPLALNQLPSWASLVVLGKP